MLFQMRFIKVLFHGRGPSIIDVGIDTLGVIAGSLVIYLITIIYKKIKANRT